ncbi:MAG: TraB/GumN family protein [SAR324 cluster bacterium]|nr:TraB/GumN family protein [SAR324 cluster bacterium]
MSFQKSPPSEPAATNSRFSQNVHVLDVADKRVHLIGTAHISAKSAEEVQQVIEAVRPESVCVELCEARHQSLTKPEIWRETDIIQVIRKKQATALLAHLILASFQRRLGDQLGIKPGAEMIQAMQSADAVGAELVLADRNIQITLLRTWRNLGWLDKFKVMFQLLLTLTFSPKLEAEDVEKLKDRDMLTQVMEAFSSSFPKAKASLIDERDLYLAENIRTAPGRSVVAVVGAGHLDGILARLASGEPVDLAPLQVVPRASRVLLGLQWLIPLLVLGLIGYGFFWVDAEVSWQMVKIWVLANGILAAVGSALALAHPLTIATAFVAAPITSLNPMVAAGWVAGLCEAWLNKPKVRDFEALAGDITSLRGFWKNRITRILLVVALANLGSSIGTFVGIPLMSSLLG